MATKVLEFIWNPITGYWEPASAEAKKKFGNQNKVLAEQVRGIEGAEVFEQGNNIYLRIPTNKLPEAEQFTQSFQPGDISQEIPILRNQPDVMTYANTLKSAANRVKKIATAYEDFRARVGTGPLVQQGTSLAESAGIRRGEPGLAANVSKWISENKNRPVQQQEALPRAEKPQVSSGYGAPITIAAPGSVASATPKDRPFSGIPSPTSFQPVQGFTQDQLAGVLPRSGTVGLFDIPELGEGFVFLAQPGSTTSIPIDLESWKTNIYSYTPQQVQEYKRAIGFKEQSGAVTPEFVNTLTSQMLTVSEINYRNARNNKRQISFEEYVVNPQKFGGEIAGGTGVIAGPSAQEIKAKNEAVKILATEIGVGIDDATANRLARDWAIGNYDATSIRAVIARSGTIDFTKGAAAQTIDNLRQYAADFGVQYDDAWFNRATTNILTGKDAEETYNNSIRQIAKSRYPTFSDQIDAGFTIRQLASPYIQTMSSILELDSGSIGLNDPFITQAMTGLNTEGKPSTKPLWQFEQELRKDPRWNFTNNAQQSLMNTARQVLQDFGLVS